MKRRVHRPYVRRRPGAADAAGSSARLASLAGRAVVERLEPRQLLFSLTISADDVDASGLGSARAIFGYTVPALTTLNQVGTNQAQVVIEDFAEVVPGNLGGNVEFDDSFMRLKHNVQPPRDMQIIADVDGDGDPIQGTERLIARLADPTEFFSVEFDGGEDLAVDNINRPMQSLSIDFDRFDGETGGTFGLPYANLRADVYFGEDIIASFSGNELRDLNAAPIGIDGVTLGRGTFVFDSDNPAIGTTFTRVAFVAETGPSDAFVVDNIQATFTAGNFAEIVNARIFGAEVTFRGPVGASVQLLDVYGRDLVNTIRLGIPDGLENVVLVDQNDDGIPDFNDGIGQIIFSGVDSRSSFTMWGGVIEPGDDPTASTNVFNLPNDRYQEGTGDLAFTFERWGDFFEAYSAFEASGFGHAIVTDGDQIEVVGLPPGPGGVVIGSPIVRDLDNYNPAGVDPNTGSFVGDPSQFNRTDQGIRVLDGASMGRVNIPGIIYGSSQFTGAIEELALGTLAGSITVEGDVGMLAISGDAGTWSVDPGLPNPAGVNDINRTESEIIIGRTVREIAIAGRSLADVTVLGDVSDPKARPPLDVLDRAEREWITPFDEGSGVGEADVLRAMLEDYAFVPGSPTLGQTFFFGEQFYRNDTILSAEWIGNVGSSAVISGNLGLGDPGVNTLDDPADVFAFATDGGTVQIEAAPETARDPIHVRVVDEDGRTLAALDTSVIADAPPGTELSRVLTFEPPAPGVYYLVIGAPQLADGNTDVGASYRVALTGLAPTTVGQYRMGAGHGSSTSLESNSFIVLDGDVGSIRVGTSYALGDGEEGTPNLIANSREGSLDEMMDLRTGSFSVPGTLYDLTTGSDLGFPDIGLQGQTTIFNIGGDLGQLHTGLSQVVGVSPDEGDVNYVIMNVGGRVGFIDILGDIGIDQDPDPDTLELLGLQLTTGTAGGSGDIGMIRVGGHVRGGSLLVETPDGATIGGFLVSQDAGTTNLSNGDIGIIGNLGGLNTQMFTSGGGSDIRFVDFPQIDLEQSVDAGIDLFVGQTVELTDDTGGTVRITITGLQSGAPVGFVRFLPIDGSEGVAIAQIEANLSGGRFLNIASSGEQGENDPVSIGTINITDATGASEVNIDGSVPVDVYRIIQSGGAAFNQIVNSTPGGDIVAIDVVGINRVDITTGSLGRTELPEFGPSLIGPDLGVQAGLAGDVGGPLGISADVMHPVWSGQIYRPTNEAGIGTAYMDDIGGPMDGFLDGLVVRSGDVTEVTVGGQVGDVILQGAGAELLTLTVNRDRTTPRGGFDGIVGVIYAPIVGNVDIGDGIATSAQSPIATSGIFAEDEIRSIDGGGVRGASISGNIIAANNAFIPFDFGGINSITLDGGGDFVDAFIAVDFFDSFFRSVDFQDDRVFAGDIGTISGNRADFFRSQVRASNISTFELTDGVFDASRLTIGDNAQRISATGYRNSTATGSVLEFSRNEIIIGQDLFTLETQTPSGVMSDLRVDVLGSVRTSISAGTILRTSIDVDNEIKLLEAFGGIRGSAITAGRAPQIVAGDSIVASDISISGPLETLSAGVSIVNTDIRVTGRNGRLDLLTADQLISGSLFASAPIGLVRTTSGDIVLDITTTTDRGRIDTLDAARDLIINASVSAGVGTIGAGRHIGSIDEPGVILIEGDLSSISIPNGQLYSDIRIGGTLGQTGGGGAGGEGGVSSGVVIGRATNLATDNNLGHGSIYAFGRIGVVTINGDFAGTIRSGSGGIQSVAINNGSLLPEGAIIAEDGSLESVVITGGHLLGDIRADFDIVDLQVVASADGIFGDVGINPNLSPNTQADAFRNELPLGVSISGEPDGPSITAGHDIVSFVVTGGSVFEASVYAGRQITLMSVAGGIANDGETTGTGTVIAAGDTIQSITIDGTVKDTLFVAGLLDLGADGAAGGTGADADVVHEGHIVSIAIGGDARRVGVSSGMNAGPDGEYLTRDETTALGLSTIQSFTVAGNASNVSVSGDSVDAGARGGGAFAVFGTKFDVDDGRIVSDGQTGDVIDAGGIQRNFKGRRLTMTFTGAGQATFDADGGRIILRDTDATSTLTIRSNKGDIKDLDIVSSDDASIGVLDIRADLIGTSSIVIDGDAQQVLLRDVDTTGDIRFGGDVGALSAGNITAGHLDMQHAGSISFTNLGDADPRVRGEASISVLSAGSITAGGHIRGLISVQRDLGSLDAARDIDNALIRVGGSLGAGVLNDSSLALSARNLLESRISVRDFLGAVTIAGDMFDSAIMIGADLGTDGDFGGSGLAADIVSTGFASSIDIGGDFFQSDIIEGALRGDDGFFGTGDDSIADGRGVIGLVTIVGDGVGSSRFTESYRIFSTGQIEGVTIGGSEGEDQGNFAIVDADTLPVPIRVLDLSVSEASRVYSATIQFNQAIDASTLRDALSIREVRGVSGDVEIFLIQGDDYTVSYNAEDFTATITFDRNITSRDLPRLSGVPGPGIYRFVLNADILRGQAAGVRLDGNADGFALPGDVYSQDTIVGDAGDKLTDITVQGTGDAGEVLGEVDFYSAINLDIVLDDNLQRDGLPDANRVFTIRGTIGDHPDHDTDFFRFVNDVDAYTITLQAGQILRIGPSEGSAFLAQVAMFNEDGTSALGGTDFNGDPVDPKFLVLPATPTTPNALGFEQNYLVLETGTYVLAVGNAGQAFAFPTVIPDIESAAGFSGDYRFDIEIFDDGDSGFAETVDSGDGQDVVDAPTSASFAGPDGELGTSDDFASIVVGGFTFTLDPGPDGTPGTNDDIVSGDNGDGISSTRAGGILTSRIESSIGPAGHSGIPDDVYADVDIYHLNAGGNIAPGTILEITIKLTESGADLGSRLSDALTLASFADSVEFGVFDTTNATGLSDALLVLSPTDFSPNGGEPGVLAENGNNRYGFNDDGDFFIQFVTPGALDGSGGAPYAIYLQGAFNTDYAIEVRTLGSAEFVTRAQNFFIETQGGSIDWLRAGGLVADLDPFSTKSLGLSGTNEQGVPIDQVVLDGLLDRLEQLYADRGLDVTFSTNPADFEFEDFSTIYLTSTPDPVNPIFAEADFFGGRDFFQGLGTDLLTQPFQVAEHADPFNTDSQDEGAVFLPTFARLGYEPTDSDIDDLIDSLTAATAQTVNELLGLRQTASNGLDPEVFDINAADAVQVVPGDGEAFEIPTVDRALSDPFDPVTNTDFWLGEQNASQLLEKILSTI